MELKASFHVRERSHTTSRAKWGGGVSERVTIHLKEIGKCVT